MHQSDYIQHIMNYPKKNRFQFVPIAELCLYNIGIQPDFQKLALYVNIQFYFTIMSYNLYYIIRIVKWLEITINILSL